MPKNNSKKKAVVWLVNRNAGHDYSAAQKYGSLVPISEGLVYPFATDRFLERAGERLRDFAADDFLLLSGNLLLNAVAIGYLAHRLGWLRVLVFHQPSRSYQVRFVDFRHLDGTNQKEREA